MPQLFSRMDNANWLTPAIAEILDQGAAPPGGGGTIREQILQIERELTDLGTPARIINPRPTPAYTLFFARLGSIGRLGNRRTVSHQEIRRSLGQIAEQHKTWTLGFLPQPEEDADTVGILLRTEEHQAQSLRRMLVRSEFRNHPSTLAVPLGITLDQQLLVEDLSQRGHLVIVGADKAKQQFVLGLLLTLSLLNTPGELRLAIAGQSSQGYKALISTPHTLGRLLQSPDDGQRLLDGLVKEVQRRQQWFESRDVDSLDAYNALLREQGETESPQIILALDSLSAPDWQESRDRWAPPLYELLANGANAGIYLILTADTLDDPILPAILDRVSPTQIVMRSAGDKLSENLENFHGSLLRFINAYVVTKEEERVISPVELCSVSPDEVQRAIAYWRQASIQRAQETPYSQISGKTGVTGVLRPVGQTDTLPNPPTPQKPSPDTLARAAQALSNAPVEAEAASVHQIDENDWVLSQAHALAAYLGWIGVGPLHDILGLDMDKAQLILTALREIGIIETTASPTPRFMRGTEPKTND